MGLERSMWKEHEIRCRISGQPGKGVGVPNNRGSSEKGCGIQGNDPGMGDVDTMRGLNRVKRVRREKLWAMQ